MSIPVALFVSFIWAVTLILGVLFIPKKIADKAMNGLQTLGKYYDRAVSSASSGLKKFEKWQDQINNWGTKG